MAGTGAVVMHTFMVQHQGQGGLRCAGLVGAQETVFEMDDRFTLECRYQVRPLGAAFAAPRGGGVGGSEEGFQFVMGNRVSDDCAIPLKPFWNGWLVECLLKKSCLITKI